ncbi:MAG TPA: low molecular weight protein-tyrosine-phosphatase [Ignavibacteriaceae bacterium]|nr:low molecular weight protein-tyrosine-phosphatase [Ignavibacteriaceae bacterium]
MTKKKILFVCLGNICRSPAAEGIMHGFIKSEGLENQIEVDSAGTMGYHTGEKADPRMRKHASQRGYDLTSLARRFNPEKDFRNFDYIVTMDNQNYEDVISMDRKNEYSSKILKMAQFCKTHKVNEVPDPYYSGSEGFENVLDILEDGCNNLLTKIKDELK